MISSQGGSAAGVRIFSETSCEFRQGKKIKRRGPAPEGRERESEG